MLNRKALMLITLVGAGATLLAHNEENVRNLFAGKLPNVPGQTLTAEVVEYPPGATSGVHHHAGSVFAYVLTGSIRSQNSATGAVRVYKAGEAFFEPPGSDHLVSENASVNKPASLLAIHIAEDGAVLTKSGNAKLVFRLICVGADRAIAARPIAGGARGATILTYPNIAHTEQEGGVCLWQQREPRYQLRTRRVEELPSTGSVAIDSGEHRESINPATGKVIGSYAKGGRKEGEAAVNAGIRAFRGTDWRHNRTLRSRVLNSMAACFEARAEQLAQLLGAEVGKILPHARFETASVPLNLRFNAALTLTDYGRAAEVDEDSLSIIIRQPVGVAGIFAPWNAPLALAIRSLAPALAAGCTAVAVLPEQTAQVNALISEVISDTEGLPPGVVNIITSGREAIKYLVESPDVPVISFTGSTQVGRAISAAGAARLKRFGLELGGKTPMVIFDDADLDAVVAKVSDGLTVFAGQFCMTASRAIVQRGIADRFRSALAERLKGVRVGPASDPASEMGPLINKTNVERVNKMVEDAIAAGAKVIVRGGPVTEAPLAPGAFYRPTLLEVTDSSLPIVQQEVFGPVLTMHVFDTESAAISLANDGEYGLAASVWSRDVDRPLRVARALQAGMVWINDWASIHDEFEEGGFKQSGRGRLRGQSGLDDFLECKHIAFKRGKAKR